MIKGYWGRLMEAGATPGTAIASSTTETSLLAGSDVAQETLWASYFDRLSKSMRIKIGGRMSTVVTTPGTLNLYVRFGSIDVWDSGAMPLNIVAKTNVPWELEVELFAVTKGATTTATLKGVGRFTSEAYIGAAAATAGGNGVILLPYNTAPAAGAGFDSTSAQLLDFMAKFSVSNAANSIRMETLAVDVMV